MRVLISRVLVSLVFLYAACQKVMDWDQANQFLMQTIANWQIQLQGSLFLSDLFRFFLGKSEILLGAAICLEVIGAVMLLIGFRPRIGAILLLIFLIPTTLLMHAFWFRIGPDVYDELGVFLKNCALIGALLHLSIPTEKLLRSK